MTSDPNPSGSYLLSNRNSKTDDTYLKELNEDLKLRKQELLEMLKPLEDKNNLLLQKLLSNLEEKQRSLQIMRQIMTGKGCDESSVMELIKEAEEMKQNLERKNKMLRKEMEMLWNKTFETEEVHDQQNAAQIKPKADLQERKRLFLPPGKATEEDGMGQVPGTSQHLSGTMGNTNKGRATTEKNEPNVRIMGSKTYIEQQEATETQSDDVGERLFILRSLPEEALKD
ncbi:putative coiled-coil domain-containing protein 196 isoform X3 [Dipodomys merriami]|uniref:putative coiled-coil domain-containing protein 196 isoform X3 n=1 Tax=Dipodomys merriami TaxID=94247 RepID=UPI00385106F2